MPSSSPQESLAASQRLLDYIQGNRQSPAAAPQTAQPRSDALRTEAPAAWWRTLRAHHGASTIGIALDFEGIMLSRTHRTATGEPFLDDLSFVPYPAGTDVTSIAQRVAVVARALKSFAPDYAKCRVWTMLNKIELCLITLPPVKEAERDAVALLKVGQQTKFDTADLCFDYRLQSSPAKGEEASAVAVVASRRAVEELVAAFKKAGIPLTGITTPKLSPMILLDPKFGRAPWQNLATVHIADDSSSICIISNHQLKQHRTINFGRSLFLSRIVDRLANADGTISANTESGRMKLLHEANELLANHAPNEAERQTLSDALDDNVRRIVSYITRTVNYYLRVEKGVPLEGLLITASHGVGSAIHTEVEHSLDLRCAPYSFPGRRSTAADAAIRSITEQFKTSTMVDAIGLGFADADHIPNLLDTPSLRRTKRRHSLVRRVASWAVMGLSAALLLSGGYFVWEWYDASEALARKEAQYSTIRQPLTPEMLRTQTAKIAQLERTGAELLKKRRFAALMAEVAAIKGDGIYITGMSMNDAAQDASVNANRRDAKPRSGRRVLTISALLFQTPQEREAALASFLTRLEANLKDAAITVRRDPPTDGGIPVVIRMEGNF